MGPASCNYTMGPQVYMQSIDTTAFTGEIDVALFCYVGNGGWAFVGWNVERRTVLVEREKETLS